VEFRYHFEKNFFIFFRSSETSRFVTAMVAALIYRQMGCRATSQRAYEFWQRTSRKNGHHVFWALTAENGFL
jgi:hypothetical protein